MSPEFGLFQMMWNAKFEGWECIEAGRQLQAAWETGSKKPQIFFGGPEENPKGAGAQPRSAVPRGDAERAVFRRTGSGRRRGDAMACVFLRTPVHTRQ